jgi:hypothetical protein
MHAQAAPPGIAAEIDPSRGGELSMLENRHPNDEQTPGTRTHPQERKEAEYRFLYWD